MSKKKRDGWKVVAYEAEPAKVEETPVNTTQRFRANIDTSAVSDEDFNWEKVRCNITESFSEIIAYKERLSAKLNQIEAELCDAHGKSQLGETLREGIVFRSKDGKQSFKAVDPQFLLKYDE